MYLSLVPLSSERGYNAVAAFMMLIPTVLWLQNKIFQLINFALDKILDKLSETEERYSDESRITCGNAILADQEDK